MAVKLFKKLLFLGLLSVSFADNLSFKLGLRLEDNLNDVRNFIVDTTSSNDFVLNSRQFLRPAGKHNTFNPDKSSTLEKLTRQYSVDYIELYNDANSSVKGILVEDALFSPVANVRFRFGVVDTVEGQVNPAKSNDGQWSVGRVGLDRSTKGQTTLKQGLFDLVLEHTLCGSIVESEDAHIVSTDLGYPSSRYESSKIIAIPAETNSNLWKISSVKVSLQNTQSSVRSAVLSTTLDALSLPVNEFSGIIKEFGAVKENGEYYVEDLSKLSNILVSVKEIVFEVKPSAFTEPVNQRYRLKLRSNTENVFVLGTPFWINNGYCLDFVKNEVTFFKPSQDLSLLQKKQVRYALNLYA
ncbi:unnamed protein product [Bursaphelenchus xylophilus]|uniref:(pine wood nematode) hypothetical protein n=1 Tax=Bursaphelenchus xylophilus TaxID=6326 RepID=A0A7I8X6Z3_BURXY|nr:unnamed protein product [Bursaphelenchus xylophilus]CAG9126630.1 unnamed protein product [Bursaphelenchus xylophilus]